MNTLLEGFKTVFSEDNLRLLLEGTVLTLEVSAVSLLISVTLGTLSGWVRFARVPILAQMAQIHVTLTRGVPLLIQLSFVYYGLPAVGIQLESFPAGVLALGLYSAAYVSEIVRGGLNSVDLGQLEAARSLGLSGPQSMRHIILPQALVAILPPLGNEYISLILGSSLISAVTLDDLTRQGGAIIAQTYRQFEVYTVLAAVYFIITYTLTPGIGALERRYLRGRRVEVGRRVI